MKHSDGVDAEDWRAGGFGLYVHWPFCESKCPYCDFNSHVAQSVDHKAWAAAYGAEIARLAAVTPGRVLNSVYFGGGTPSLMEPETVGLVIEAAQRAWTPANALEVTLEANPSSVEIGRFRGFADAGVNRVSLRIQSLNDKDLRALGRRHDVRMAKAAWDVATTVFDRASFDLIYARQNQSLESWSKELSEALAMNPTHMSLYQLTVEDGTAFGDRFRKGTLRGLPNDDLGADMYDLTQRMCDDSGMPAYEVSNHAKPGMESNHNLLYWRGGDYVGIGPGAHGRLTVGGVRHAQAAEKMPTEWLRSASQHKGGQTPPHESLDALDEAERAAEYLMMSLRLREGSDLARFPYLVTRSETQKGLADLVTMGLAWRDGTRIGATSTGRPLLNALLRELL